MVERQTGFINGIFLLPAVESHVCHDVIFPRPVKFVPNKLQDTAFIKVSHHAIPRSVNRFVHLSVGLKFHHNISYMKGTSG